MKLLEFRAYRRAADHGASWCHFLLSTIFHGVHLIHEQQRCYVLMSLTWVYPNLHRLEAYSIPVDPAPS